VAHVCIFTDNVRVYRQRPEEKVAEDLKNGYVTPEQAEGYYEVRAK
jgi:DNA polymerase/3'-5' exonuclease PolX